MTKVQRIRSILVGVLLLLLAFILLAIPEGGIVIVVLLLGMVILVDGLRYLFYYLFMARHMVGGKALLYRGIIMMDLGIFAPTLALSMPVMMLMYLLFLYGLSGVINILRGREARKMGAPLWKKSIFQGMVNLTLVIIGTIFLREPQTVIYVYSAGLIFSGIDGIVSAFRRTAIVYIA